MKKINQKYKLLIFLYLFIVIPSCKSLVDVDPPANQISTALVFQDIQTANAALAGIYAGLWEDSPITGGGGGSGALMGIYTDDLDYFAASLVNAHDDLFKNIQIDANTTVFYYWSSAYQKIYQANAVLEGVELSSGISSQDKQRLKGEALFIRSILLFYLQQSFGDVPYPITPDYKINLSISRTPSAEALDRLEGDLKEVISLLSDQYRESERIVPNRKVAEFLLAKVLMTKNQWIEAEAVLKNIMNSPLYEFENDLSKVFIKTGKHILWQLKPKNAVDVTKEALTFYFTNAAPSSYALSDDLMNSFTAEDLRKTQWITAVTFNQVTKYRSSKYKVISNNSTEYSIVFRLEEVYLLLAEALAQQTKMPEAIPFINATRQRAGLLALPSSITKEALLTEITAENRKEFFAEMGNRFMHLKRRGLLKNLVTVKPNFKSYHVVWPVPQKDLMLNQNLNPQNEGY